MSFYVQGNLENKTAVFTRLTENGQDTRIELSFDNMLRALDDFISDSGQLSNEQFEKLLDAADAIQEVSTMRAAEAECARCDGTNCINCGNFRTITG